MSTWKIWNSNKEEIISTEKPSSSHGKEAEKVRQIDRNMSISRSGRHKLSTKRRQSIITDNLFKQPSNHVVSDNTQQTICT